MHQSIPTAPIPPRANPRALALFFVLGGKFPGVGMKEESKCLTPGIRFELEIHNHNDFSRSRFSVVAC